MPTAHDLVGAGILIGTFVGLLLACELWRKLANAEPEHTRKLAHLGSGIGCLAIPFLIKSPWMVLAVALTMSSAFALSQKLGILKSLHAVGRKSRGSEYYPVAIFLTFLIAQGNVAIYVASVLVLAVGDAFAALVGIKYGQIHYEVEESKKSVEGSLAFMVIAFLSIHLPLLLLTDLPREHCVLSALLVATLVTLFEAVSLGGADNLFIPIGVSVALQKIIAAPVHEAAFQTASLYVMAITVFAIAYRVRWFNVGATLVVILYAFGAWALGGWMWALPVVIGLITTMLGGLRASNRRAGSVKVRYIAGMVAPPFLFLILGNMLKELDWFFGPYLAAIGVVTVFWVRANSRHFRDRVNPMLLFAIATGSFLCSAFLPWILQTDRSYSALGACGAVIALASLGEAFWTNAWNLETQPGRWTARRFVFSTLAGAAVFGLQWSSAIDTWEPSTLPQLQEWRFRETALPLAIECQPHAQDTDPQV